MSVSPLDDLIGLRITSHEPVEDYVQFIFNAGAAILTVYNPYEIRGPEPASGQSIISVVGRHVLAGATVPGVVVELKLDGGWSIEIDIRDEAYSGPEAIVLHRPGSSTVVWT